MEGERERGDRENERGRGEKAEKGGHNAMRVDTGDEWSLMRNLIVRKW